MLLIATLLLSVTFHGHTRSPFARVFDGYTRYIRPGGGRQNDLHSRNGRVSLLIDAGFNCTTSIDCNVDQQLARQQAAGLQRQIASIPPNFDGDNNPLTDPSNTALVINGGKSRVQGVEGDLNLQFGNLLTLSGSMSYVDAKYTEIKVPAIFAPLGGTHRSGVTAFQVPTSCRLLLVKRPSGSMATCRSWIPGVYAVGYAPPRMYGLRLRYEF